MKTYSNHAKRTAKGLGLDAMKTVASQHGTRGDLEAQQRLEAMQNAKNKRKA